MISMNKALDNRLRRVAGQLEKLQINITQDADCAEVIPQFLAVKGALAAAFELYVNDSIIECTNSDDQKLEKLIALLVRT